MTGQIKITFTSERAANVDEGRDKNKLQHYRDLDSYYVSKQGEGESMKLSRMKFLSQLERALKEVPLCFYASPSGCGVYKFMLFSGEFASYWPYWHRRRGYEQWQN